MCAQQRITRNGTPNVQRKHANVRCADSSTMCTLECDIAARLDRELALDRSSRSTAVVSRVASR
eukprot:3485772-Prymnesium_polylepis.2